MKVHEYQAKAMFAGFGIPIPRGKVVSSPQEAREAAEPLGRVVLKAQVYAGGRGKGGGIKIASSPEEAEALARKMLGIRLVTPQTGPEGVPVSRLLVEEAVDIARELYAGLVLDFATQQPVFLVSEAGGMEIEEVAASSPEKLHRAPIDPLLGFPGYLGRKLAYALNLEGPQVQAGAEIFANLYRLFQSKDCTLAEINPLVVTREGKLLALDAKLNFDDNALFRHPELAQLHDPEQEDPIEAQARQAGISYIRLDGDVGCMVNGAGLAMATMDIIQKMGSRPANFLDVGGGASGDQVTRAFKILLADPRVKKVLVNVFGGILRCDVVAQGILEATKDIKVRVPIVVRMQGTNAEEGQRLLAQSGLPVNLASSLEEAARKVVALR